MAGTYSEVAHTFCASGIEPDSGVIVGGAVLGFHGIRPANDVDIIVKPELFEQIAQEGQTPSGMPLIPLLDGTRLLNEVPGPGLLPLDLLLKGVDFGQDAFNHALENSELARYRGGLTIRVATLSHVMAVKRFVGRRKDRGDIRLIERHLAN